MVSFQNLISQPNKVRFSWNFQSEFLGVFQDDPKSLEGPHPQRLQSRTFNILQVWSSRMQALDTLIIMLESWDLAYKLSIIYDDNPWCQEWPHPPSIQIGSINVRKVWTSWIGILDTLLIMLESWNLANKSRIAYNDNPWHQGWPHYPGILSGTINVLQVWTSRT